MAEPPASACARRRRIRAGPGPGSRLHFARLARICALNNYPLLKMWERAEAGISPRQHAWGVDRLVAAGHSVDFAPFHEPDEADLLDQLSLRAHGLLGHLDQEAYAVRRLRRHDVLYCADQIGLSGLALARGVLPATRLVSVVHHPPGHRLRRLALTRQNVLVGLSAAVCTELSDHAGTRAARIVHLAWGPDLECPLYRPAGEGNGVVSAGKSNRDLATLVAAMSACRAPGLVYDLECRLPNEAGTDIRIVRPGRGTGVDPDSTGGFTAARAIADLSAAAVVAIPVNDPARLTGLTEAADAIALAKPIVATRSRYFPFDIEAIGCGIWVKPGDRQGWRTALAALLADPDRRRAMGSAGRRYAERSCNYKIFGDGLIAAVTAPDAA